MPRRQLRQLTEPFEVPMMPFAVGGTVLWAIAGAVLLVFRDDLAAAGRTHWLWTCLAGVVAGAVGILTMHVRARRGVNRSVPPDPSAPPGPDAPSDPRSSR